MRAKRLIPGLIFLLLLMQGCERDLDQPTARLSISNMTELRLPPERPLSIWAVYITASNSLSPALDRSVDLLASSALKPGISQTFTIDTCGQALDIQVIFSDGSEQLFSTVTAVDCDTDYTQDVL